MMKRRRSNVRREGMTGEGKDRWHAMGTMGGGMKGKMKRGRAIKNGNKGGKTMKEENEGRNEERQRRGKGLDIRKDIRKKEVTREIRNGGKGRRR